MDAGGGIFGPLLDGGYRAGDIIHLEGPAYTVREEGEVTAVPRKRIYIAGPMTGLPNFNYDAFDEAERQLREEGWDVRNPANHFNRDQTLPRKAYMRRAIEEVMAVDAIALLPGWEKSAGARLEVTMGLELELDFYEYNELAFVWTIVPPSMVRNWLNPVVAASGESILQEAQRLVHGDRQQDYGHPYEDFNRTAGIWNAMFGHKLLAPFTAEDVAIGMIGVKLSRQVNKNKRDNLVDICGYTETLFMVRERMKEMGDG